MSKQTQNIKPSYYRFIKRAFDIVFSLAVLVISLIPGLILCAFVAFDTKGAPFYSQMRMGHLGAFPILKFRTMVSDSDNVEKYLNAEQLKQWCTHRKVQDDPRITPLGKILRATSIDEFPQFINVLLGHMSIIGPRCITSDELDYLGEDKIPYLSVPGGITGLWQTSERNDATFANGRRKQIELDYVNRACLSLDAQIFFATFKTMFIRKNGQ